VAILLALGLGGLGYAFTSPDASVSLGLSGLDGLAPLVAAPLSFVAFQGWQLLLYDEEVITDESTTVPRAIFLSIAGEVVVYVLVALVTTNLAAQAVEQQPETALAFAAKPLLGQAGVLLVEVAALFSTGSVINATLFSSARFAEGMLDDGLLPDEVGRAGTDSPSRRLILLLGGLTAAFTAAGSLDGITSFASLAFIAVFGVVSVLAVREREDTLTGVGGGVGVLGTAVFFPLLCYRLVTDRLEVAWTVLVIAVVVVGTELLYFERETLVEEAVAVEQRL
jgi:amino acid transporter